MRVDRSQGVTLVEILVVIAIVAILAALAIPSFSDYFQRSRLRGAADSVAALLASSRGEAVRLNRQVNVSFGGTAANWCVGANAAAAPARVGDLMPNAAACDCTNAASCSSGVVSANQFPGVTVTSVAANATFNPKLGTTIGLANQNFSFISRDANYRLETRVTPLGHVRTCRLASSAFIAGYEDCP